MRKITAIGAAAAFILGVGVMAGAMAMAEVKSLRGDLPPDAEAKPPQKVRVMSQSGGYKRAWRQQPPLIPHRIDRERISLDENSCLRCHAPDTHQAEHAPMISKTHFTDPDKPSDQNLMRSRWFCNQCHVPQVGAEPLVENVFGR